MRRLRKKSVKKKGGKILRIRQYKLRRWLSRSYKRGFKAGFSKGLTANISQHKDAQSQHFPLQDSQLQPSARDNYLIGIGYVNRPDLLLSAIRSIEPYWPNCFVIDNSNDHELQNQLTPPPGVTVYKPPVPLTFSQTMNYLYRLGTERGCQFIMFMHNDAEASPEIAHQLLARVQELQSQGRRWGAAFTTYHSLAAYSLQAAKAIGPWDTQLPHYFADDDYYRRMRLLHFEIIETGLPVIHHNRGSSTIKSDADLRFTNDLTFPLFEEYYKAKWGGTPGAESFQRPFNLFPVAR